eukprot:SM000004S14928  [mRNA]  locus=s4:240725:242774:- [translate_table: standard]
MQAKDGDVVERRLASPAGSLDGSGLWALGCCLGVTTANEAPIVRYAGDIPNPQPPPTDSKPSKRPRLPRLASVGRCPAPRALPAAAAMGVVRLPLARFGRRNLPFYRIFAADSRFPRDGRHLEILGHYDPLPVQHSAALCTYCWTTFPSSLCIPWTGGLGECTCNTDVSRGLHVAGIGCRSVRSLRTLSPGCCTRLASCHRHQQSAPRLRAADTPGCQHHKSSGAGDYWQIKILAEVAAASTVAGTSSRAKWQITKLLQVASVSSEALSPTTLPEGAFGMSRGQLLR